MFAASRPPLLAAADSAFGAPDWATLGLVLAIVGCFLLANSILFRSPQQLVREHFGQPRERLRTLREYIFHRVQITLGFGYLLGGFSLQLYGRVRPAPADLETPFPLAWIGIVVVVTIGLQYFGWAWSRQAFRRYVRRSFAENPPNFEGDVGMAREVGDLFGVPTHGDETVQSYAARLRERLRLPAGGRSSAWEADDAPRRPLEPEPEPAYDDR